MRKWCMQGNHSVPEEKMTSMLIFTGSKKVRKTLCEDCKAIQIDRRKNEQNQR